MADWVCGVCKSINRSAANKCYSCGGARANVAVGEAPGFAAPTGSFTSQPPAGTPPGTPTTGTTPSGTAPASPMQGFGAGGSGFTPPADGTAAGGSVPTGSLTLAEEAARSASAAAAPAGPAGMGNILGGLIGGLIAAIVASGVWYAVVALSQWQIGLVAIAVGWLVGMGVVFGAGHRGSFALIPISVALTLIALIVSEYLIVAHFVSLDLGYAVELVQPPDFVAEVVIASLQADPLTLVFWGIALFQAFVIPARVPRATATPGPTPTDAPLPA